MKNLFKALAEFQQEVPVIHKDTQGYGYTYADLPKIFEVINPLLKKHGLAFTQPIRGNSISTILFHIESGESLDSVITIPENVSLKGMNDYQVLGSAITYLRRYAISSILGLVTDKDTDAAGEQTKDEKKTNEIKITKWLSEAQFNKGKESVEMAKKVLEHYDGKTEREGEIYGMKKEYRTELLKIK